MQTFKPKSNNGAGDSAGSQMLTSAQRQISHNDSSRHAAENDHRSDAAKLRVLQAMATRSPKVQRLAQLRAMVNNSPRVKTQDQLQAMFDNNPRQVAQRQQSAHMSGQPVQRHEGLDEEELQMRAAPDAVQRQSIEDEELLQKSQ